MSLRFLNFGWRYPQFLITLRLLILFLGYRWQIRSSGMPRRQERATSTSPKCDITCIAMPFIALMRSHPMHLGELSRREEKMLEHGGRLVTSPLWPSQHVKGGTLMPFLMHIPVLLFGMCPRSFVNFVMHSAAVPLLRAPCLVGAITCHSKALCEEKRLISKT